MQKKVISMILAIAMVLSLFAGISATAFATESAKVFTKITSMDQLTDGEYLVVGATTGGNYTDQAGTMLTGNSGFMGFETPVINDNTITVDGEAVTAASVWTITKTADGYTVADNAGLFLGNAEDTKNKAFTTEAAETLIIASGAEIVEGTFTISRASGTYAYLNWNYNSGNARFSFYNAQNNTAAMCAYLTLYKAGEVAPVECDHADAVAKVTTAATCIEEGVKTYTCTCGKSWTESIATIDHNYIDGTCTMCGDELPIPSDSSLFTKITSMDQLTDGEYLVVGATIGGNYADRAGTMLTGNSGFMGFETPVINGNTIALDGNAVTEASVWTITKTADGYTVADNAGLFLGNAEDTKNKAFVTEAAETLIIASGAEVAEATFTISRASGTYAYLNWNYNSGNSRFSFYNAQNNTAAMCAYLTLYKAGEGPTCDHVDAIGVVTTAATCTEEGVMTFNCTCGKSWTESIATIDHDYVDGTCTMCGDELPAGRQYALITMDNIPAGNYIVASTKKTSYDTLYTATAKVDGYWTVSDTAIAAKNDIITTAQLPADAQIFTFAGNNTDGFAVSCIVDGAKLYLGYTDAAENHTLALSAEYSNIRWNVIADAEGGFALSSPTADGAYVISDNSTAATSLRGYASGKLYNGIYLFVEVVEDGECMHGKTEIRNAVAATCAKDGYSGDTYCVLCNKKLSSGKSIAAIGHNYVEGVCANCGAKESASYGLVDLTTVGEGSYVIASTRKSTFATLYPATATIATYWTVSDTAISAKNNVVTSAQLPADAQIFTFEGNNTDGFLVSCLIDGIEHYLGYSNAELNNALALSPAYDDIRWNVIEDAEGGVALSSPTSAGAYVISDNSTATTSLRGYASGKVYNGIYLFKEGYTPDPESGATIDQNLKFNMNISASAEMVVNYNFMPASVSGYAEFYLEVQKDVAGGEPVVTTYGIDALEVMQHPTTGAPVIYNASYRGINAKEMGDNFSTTLYAVAEDGTVYRSATVVSSIRDFLVSKLNDSASIDALKTMAVDMLKYGAAAQTYFGYNTKNLVTKGLTSAQLAYATKGTPEAVDYTATTGTAANITANITVGSKVELALSCINSTTSDPANVKCTIMDSDGNIIARPEVEVKANVMFSAKYDNVGAREMREVIKAVFKDGNKHVSKTLTWSVESYVAQVRANSTDANEIAVANAMLTYGDAVAAYLTAIGQ